jgi:heterodisulfide reductase subunit A
VITTAELNRLLQKETLPDLIGQTPDPAIAFIQCVGSRNKKLGNDYCSQVCCKVALRQAGKLHSLMPRARLSLFHIDLQLIGKEIRSQARELMDHIDLLQGVAGDIRVDPQTDRLVIVREDPSRAEPKASHFDLVVLAVGMRPADNLGELTGPPGLPLDSWGFVSGRTPWPDRLQVAGAGRFPTDITGAMMQGVNAAHRIATLLSATAPQPPPGVVAVLGSGQEGAQVARAVRAAGFGTLLLDAQPASEKNGEGYELICGAHVTGLAGTPGNYLLRYLHEGRARQRQVTALVVANGIERRPMAAPLPWCTWPTCKSAWQRSGTESLPGSSSGSTTMDRNTRPISAAPWIWPWN